MSEAPNVYYLPLPKRALVDTAGYEFVERDHACRSCHEHLFYICPDTDEYVCAECGEVA